MSIMFDAQHFYAIAGYPLDSSQRGGLDYLWASMEADPAITTIPYAAYLLATVEHECGHFWLPMSEGGRPDYFLKYEEGELARQLGNTEPGDGARFKGRGYIQITGRANYTRFSKVIGKDLVMYPDTALRPAAAYRIMSTGCAYGWFTGVALSAYCNDERTDFVGARRVINGQDKAQEIAARALVFEGCLAVAK